MGTVKIDLSVVAGYLTEFATSLWGLKDEDIPKVEQYIIEQLKKIPDEEWRLIISVKDTLYDRGVSSEDIGGYLTDAFDMLRKIVESIPSIIKKEIGKEKIITREILINLIDDGIRDENEAISFYQKLLRKVSESELLMPEEKNEINTRLTKIMIDEMRHKRILEVIRDIITSA